MSKEIANIIVAFERACAAGRSVALATVVRVDGSSYRRPGARMLVEDNGQLTGAISGGCLEGDALRKAQLAIHRGQNSLVVYDTTDEDDLQFGVKLGCNGIVYILFEPVDTSIPSNPIELLKQVLAERRAAVLATLFVPTMSEQLQPGTCFFADADSQHAALPMGCPVEPIDHLQARVMASRQSIVQSLPGTPWQVLMEFMPPPVTVVVVGAGNDAIPLATMANMLGWETIVADGRDTHATRQRFPNAKEVIVAKPEILESHIQLDEHCCVLLMTHNYNYDLAVLRWLLQKHCFYIGTLGPKKRLSRILQELQNEGVEINHERAEKIHGPTGLDIGAETAEEIALSVLAEIKAVHEKRSAGFLRDRPASIHDRIAEEPKSKQQVSIK
jgi:xanthine/CO dehydrogenase XdhC/CoxF family maturation factor